MVLTAALLLSLAALPALAQGVQNVELHGYMQNRFYSNEAYSARFVTERVSLSAVGQLGNDATGYIEVYMQPWLTDRSNLPSILSPGNTVTAEEYRIYLESAYVDLPLSAGRIRIGKGRMLNFGMTPTYPNRKTTLYGILAETFTQDRVIGAQYDQKLGTFDIGGTLYTDLQVENRGIGDFAGAATTAAQGAAALDKVKEIEAKGGYERTVLEAIAEQTAAYQSLLHDDFIKARDQSRDVARLIVQVKTDGPLQEFQKYITLFTADHAGGRAEYLAGDYAAAEKSERDALAAREQSGLTNAVQDKRDIAEATTWLSLAVARQGRSAEAAKILEPALALHRQLGAKNRGELWQHVEFAFALYAQGLADKAGGSASLSRASAMIDSLPADMRALHEIRRLRDWIAAAERGAG